MDAIEIMFIVMLMITGIYTLIFLITNDLLKWYLKAKLSGAKTIVVNLNPNQTLEFSGLVRKDGIMYDKKGNVVQDYERVSEAGKKGELNSLAYTFGAVKFLFLNDGELAGLNKQGKPASLDMPYFNRLRNLEKVRLEKRNKLVKPKKAMPMSIIMLIGLAVIAIIGILALKEFVIPLISGFL